MSLGDFLNNKVKYFKFPFQPGVQAGIRTPERKTIIPYRRSSNISGRLHAVKTGIGSGDVSQVACIIGKSLSYSLNNIT